MKFQCPCCGSERLYRDGLRYLSNGKTVQRFLCRVCGYRFSDSKIKVNVFKQNLVFSNSMHNFGKRDSVNVCVDKIGFQDLSFTLGENVGSHEFSSVEKTINKFLRNRRERQVCASKHEAKNLAKMEPLKTGLAGATKKSEVIQFLWHLKKQGLKENTIKCYDAYLKTLVNSGANLLDSESVKETIANKKWSRNTKALAIASYSRFLEFKGVSWKPPRNKRVRKLPFIPLEKEIDALISGSRKKLATFLQLLKETGLRSGEAWCLKWKDIDFQNRTITINEPEKHGKPRMLKISPTMVAMLKAMQTENERVFIGKLPFFRESFRYFRQRLSVKLKNPRLLRITFHTFRHWKATMEYHKTKDILYVKQLLGHRDINTTLLYTQLVNFESDEYHTATAKTVEEATKLAEAGFEYFDALENVHIYRKRK